eukprot:CAMPEP_0114651812 /NCGR_PEP_ID=MMETSP0191-20121206/8584_1 /TAXON_ID=126664 /ORGANISM="Sorites sp." /LENGTH=313 /DNA_ID=CAMNT_0001866133 /DNA_START=53 /DNA_END=994 /DNA_ORIENTATION=-
MGGGGSKVLDAHRKNLCKQAISGSESWKDKETKMLETFKAWDTDKSGFITKEELQEVFTRLGCKVSSSELQKVLKDADADKDSKISYEEFVAWLCRAPHLEHYFKLSQDILMRNMKDAMAVQQQMQKEMEKSSNPMAAMMKIGQKLEAVQKKGQDRIDKELKPVIQKTFEYHDKDGNGVLTYDESIIFFSNYAERLGPFCKSVSELTTTQMMKTQDIKVDVSSIQKEFNKEYDKNMDSYLADIDKRHKAAFAVLDVNKDSKLTKEEVTEALLHGHPKNAEFMKALGLMIDDKALTGGAPSGKVEMDMEECPVQ